ncbi:hypothetical protein HAX54_012256 [Datura stramonium]|uniref:Uncharacterized protein n=1 Tax=Datura stramonium TaxID=4076 RepID=A0ABS8TM91_DATST|nr:hypothetical protein [Datura stramonium]
METVERKGQTYRRKYPENIEVNEAYDPLDKERHMTLGERHVASPSKTLVGSDKLKSDKGLGLCKKCSGPDTTHTPISPKNFITSTPFTPEPFTEHLFVNNTNSYMQTTVSLTKDELEARIRMVETLYAEEEVSDRGIVIFDMQEHGIQTKGTKNREPTYMIPEDARSNAWVSFDGKRRQQLSRGDSVRIYMSEHPLPTVNKSDQTGDWFHSLVRCLNWNERLDQKAL